jgi:hypothetical protein
MDGNKHENDYGDSKILLDEEMTEEDPYLQIRDELSRVSQRLAEVERRLKLLERSVNPASRVDSLHNPDLGPERKTSPIKHRYLDRVIDEARRRYKQEHHI